MNGDRRQIACPATLEGELATELHIRTEEIPPEVRDRLAAATLDLIHSILRQPGGREALDARTATRERMHAQKGRS